MEYPITIRYQAERDDFIKGIRAYYLRRSNWLGIGAFLIFTPLCLATLVLGSIQNGIAYSFETYTGLWIFVPLLLVIGILFFVINPRMAAGRLVKQERQTTGTTWQVNPDEIHISTKFGETRTDCGRTKR